METLEGRIAVITGAGGGIGRALVSAFTDGGCRVVACDHDVAALDGLAVEGRFGFDLTDPIATATGAAALVEEFGAPDILINNAGWTRAETMDDISGDAIEQELALNLAGVMRLTQALLPGMIARGHGTVVFTSSVNAASHFGNPVYSAAKAGIEAYSRAIAVEHGRHGIRSNAVAPGSTRTPAWDHRLQRDPVLAEKVGRLYALGRMVNPDEVAAAVLFLASPAASGITGVTLPVDAGATAGNLPFIDTVLRGR